MSWSPQNFRILNSEDPLEKGVCYGESKRTWVSLWKHLSIEDIILTCMEESIHQAIRSDSCGIPGEEGFDIEEEEWMMERLIWTYQGWM